MTKNQQVNLLSIEAFKDLDKLYNGLIPREDIELGNHDGGSFTWVCNFGGMDFYRKLSMAELAIEAFGKMAQNN